VEKRVKKLELAKEKQRISQRNNSCQNITKIKIWYRIKDWSWPSFRSRMNGHKKQRWPEVAEVGQEGAVQGRSEPHAKPENPGLDPAVRPPSRASRSAMAECSSGGKGVLKDVK
jgi:hypothetical protein